LICRFRGYGHENSAIVIGNLWLVVVFFKRKALLER
jgi:hypothetical protein